jgi:hypothetical protein
MTMTTTTPHWHSTYDDGGYYLLFKNNRPVVATLSENDSDKEHADELLTAVNNHQHLMEENRAMREALRLIIDAWKREAAERAVTTDPYGTCYTATQMSGARARVILQAEQALALAGADERTIDHG